MTGEKRVVVIGGGPAGIEAARTAAAAGAPTVLVNDGPIGGRAGWHSLLPSKVWLTAADTALLLEDAGRLGLDVTGDEDGFDAAALLARLAGIKQAWATVQRESLEALGVEIVEGTAAFAGERAVEVQAGEQRTRLEADAFIVAPGSVPWFPEGLKPDGRRVLAPRFMSRFEALPDSVVVVGAGATGCEFTYLFNQLGVDVTWVVDPYGVLPGFHADAGRFLAAALERQGVRRLEGHAATGIERREDGVDVVLDDGRRVSAELAFVAVGRRPDWARLNLPAAGLDPTDGLVTTDGYGRTVNPAVYLVGDATGGAMLANKAMAQGRIAARHALGLDVAPFDFHRVVLATYTEPQVAQVGTLSGVELARARVPYAAALKAHLAADGDGFLELAYRRDDRRLSGGLAVGPHAADALAPLAVALNLDATIDQLAGIYVAHPVISELAFLAARAAD